MERQVVFDAYREQTAEDHTNVQEFARSSFDHIVHDAVTRTRRYSGFNTIKSAQVEVQIAPGRFFDQDGAVYVREASVTQSMITYLAAAARRIVSVSAYGQQVETDVEERDVVVVVDPDNPPQPGQPLTVEPQAVATVRARDALLVFTSGAESADPQAPPLPVGHVEIARVLLDATQVVSITMMTDNDVTSTEELDLRTGSLETFRDQVEHRVTGLASDIAALSNRLNTKGSSRDLSQIFRDLARVKEILEIPDTASDYGADRFLTADESDVANAQGQGYDALVMEGIRFPDANADEFELDIFSGNDPNANKTNGLLLPAFDGALKLFIDGHSSNIAMAQFGFQTFDLTQMTMSRERIRYGSVFSACSNSAFWRSGVYDPVSNTFRIGAETFEVLDIDHDHGWDNPDYFQVRVRQYWIDTYQEPYWGYVPVTHTITGARIAQSFLVANDTWLTSIGFFMAVKAANEAVFVTLCEVTNGVPDLDKAVLHQTVPHASLLVNDWTRVTVVPTFLKAGKRYAVVLTSNANHQIGMSSGQNYLDGTFFYSTDGAFYQGDLTKDMLLQLWGAKFRAPQVTIEFEAINLDGGIRAIDITAGKVTPASTDLIFEVQPGGSGEWIPLKRENLSAFDATPPLTRFRGRFVGTRDIMPGLMLTGSRVRVSRPKTAFKHVSTPITLATASSTITIKYTLEYFDDAPHDFSCTLRHGVTDETPDTIETVVVSEEQSRIERTFTFILGAPISTFTLIAQGNTTSAGLTFHVAERVHWSA